MRSPFLRAAHAALVMLLSADSAAQAQKVAGADLPYGCRVIAVRPYDKEACMGDWIQSSYDFASLDGLEAALCEAEHLVRDRRNTGIQGCKVVTERIGLAAFIAHFDSTFKPGNFREHERRNTTNIRGVLWSVVAECDNSRCHSGCSIGAFEGAARMLQAAHAIPSHAFNQSIYRSCDGLLPDNLPSSLCLASLGNAVVRQGLYSVEDALELCRRWENLDGTPDSYSVELCKQGVLEGYVKAALSPLTLGSSEADESDEALLSDERRAQQLCVRFPYSRSAAGTFAYDLQIQCGYFLGYLTSHLLARASELPVQLCATLPTSQSRTRCTEGVLVARLQKGAFSGQASCAPPPNPLPPPPPPSPPPLPSLLYPGAPRTFSPPPSPPPSPFDPPALETLPSTSSGAQGAGRPMSSTGPCGDDLNQMTGTCVMVEPLPPEVPSGGFLQEFDQVASNPTVLEFCGDVVRYPVLDNDCDSLQAKDLLLKIEYEELLRSLGGDGDSGPARPCAAALKTALCHMTFPFCYSSVLTGHLFKACMADASVSDNMAIAVCHRRGQAMLTTICSSVAGGSCVLVDGCDVLAERGDCSGDVPLQSGSSTLRTEDRLTSYPCFVRTREFYAARTEDDVYRDLVVSQLNYAPQGEAQTFTFAQPGMLQSAPLPPEALQPVRMRQAGAREAGAATGSRPLLSTTYIILLAVGLPAIVVLVSAAYIMRAGLQADPELAEDSKPGGDTSAPDVRKQAPADAEALASPPPSAPNPTSGAAGGQPNTMLNPLWGVSVV